MNTRSKRLKLILLLQFIPLLLTACISIPSTLQRQVLADLLAVNYQWQAQQVTTSQFDLITYQPKRFDRSKLLTIYIEGDGMAWLTKNTISTDPTPINPVGLKLALNHLRGNAVYLARPCQYTGGISARNCNKHYWTDSRFAEVVIASANESLNILKAKFNAHQLQLVGYSGGGAIAALLAARRDDVVSLITVAGNLDHQAWTAHHNISPLLNSLNPADYRQQLTHIKRIYFVGAKDKIIPPFLAKQFVAEFDTQSQGTVIVVPEFDHHCCWDEHWKTLLNSQY